MARQGHDTMQTAICFSKVMFQVYISNKVGKYIIEIN